MAVTDTLDIGLTYIPGSASPSESAVAGQQIFWYDVTFGAGLAPGGSRLVGKAAVV